MLGGNSERKLLVKEKKEGGKKGCLAKGETRSVRSSISSSFSFVLKKCEILAILREIFDRLTKSRTEFLKKFIQKICSGRK
jgi:hypothetical protein